MSQYILSDPESNPTLFAREFHAVADQLAGKSVMIDRAVAEYETRNRGTGEKMRRVCIILRVLEEVNQPAELQLFRTSVV